MNGDGSTAVEMPRVHLGRRKKGVRRTKTVSFTLPPFYVRLLDSLVEAGLFDNRSEAIRFAILLLLQLHRATMVGYR
ncbi:MAG: type II toxin-antitoxin system ParD family antitoxin [Thermofilum sp.]